MRSLQAMDKDAPVLGEAAKSWNELNSATAATAPSREHKSIKTLHRRRCPHLPTAAWAALAGGGYILGGGGGRGGGGGFGGRGGGGFGGGAAGGSPDAVTRSLGLPSAGVSSVASSSSAEQAREKLVQYSQQSQFVNGRNFFQNGNQWTDSEVQNNQAAKHVRLQLNSPEYFSFLAKNQQALPWLALGQNVQFVLDGTVYEVYE